MARSAHEDSWPGGTARGARGGSRGASSSSAEGSTVSACTFRPPPPSRGHSRARLAAGTMDKTTEALLDDALGDFAESKGGCARSTSRTSAPPSRLPPPPSSAPSRNDLCPAARRSSFFPDVLPNPRPPDPSSQPRRPVLGAREEEDREEEERAAAAPRGSWRPRPPRARPEAGEAPRGPRRAHARALEEGQEEEEAGGARGGGEPVREQPVLRRRRPGRVRRRPRERPVRGPHGRRRDGRDGRIPASSR